MEKKVEVEIKTINVLTDEEEIVKEVITVNEEEIAKQELQAKISEAKQYLASTAWYVERLNDPSSGKAIPEEVVTKRAEARALINSLEIELKGVTNGDSN